MSTIRTATLANLAGTDSPDIAGGELARARFNLNGAGTIAARDSFNVSSYVDNGLGDYSSNWAVAFPNANYTVNSNAAAGSETPTSSVRALIATSVVVGSVRNIGIIQTNSATDYTYCFVTVFGDKP